MTEGDSGTVDATFAVSLNAASGLPVTVDFATSDGNCDRTRRLLAAAGNSELRARRHDEDRRRDGQGGRPRRTERDVHPQPLQPGERRDRRTARPPGRSPTTTPSRRSRSATSSITEGRLGHANATFTVTLSAVSGRNVTVNYATANGSATLRPTTRPAAGRSRSRPARRRRRSPCRSSATLLDEADTRRSPSTSRTPLGATVGDAQGIGTITDDDAAVAGDQRRDGRPRATPAPSTPPSPSR